MWYLHTFHPTRWMGTKTILNLHDLIWRYSNRPPKHHVRPGLLCFNLECFKLNSPTRCPQNTNSFIHSSGVRRKSKFIRSCPATLGTLLELKKKPPDFNIFWTCRTRNSQLLYMYNCNSFDRSSRLDWRVRVYLFLITIFAISIHFCPMVTQRFQVRTKRTY